MLEGKNNITYQWLEPLLLPATTAARGGDGDGGPGDMALYVI